MMASNNSTSIFILDVNPCLALFIRNKLDLWHACGGGRGLFSIGENLRKFRPISLLTKVISRLAAFLFADSLGHNQKIKSTRSDENNKVIFGSRYFEFY